jgi:hypothetical protein
VGTFTINGISLRVSQAILSMLLLALVSQGSLG